MIKFTQLSIVPNRNIDPVHHWWAGCILHSDRGSQYCSDTYRKLIKDHRLTFSISAKVWCSENACAESFNSLMVEAIHGEIFATRKKMRQRVFEYIELDYNRTSRRSAGGFVSPKAFEAQYIA